MKKIFASFVLFASAITNAQGIWIEGTANCGLWLEGRSLKLAQNLENYTLGMVNGLALGRMIDIWRAKGVTVSREQLFFWMDEYCRKNPLKGLVEGSHDFADEMTDGAFKKSQRK